MSTTVIILAAGKGTRMRSTLPKVLQPLAGRPLSLRSMVTVAIGFKQLLQIKTLNGLNKQNNSVLGMRYK